MIQLKNHNRVCYAFPGQESTYGCSKSNGKGISFMHHHTRFWRYPASTRRAGCLIAILVLLWSLLGCSGDPGQRVETAPQKRTPDTEGAPRAGANASDAGSDSIQPGDLTEFSNPRDMILASVEGELAPVTSGVLAASEGARWEVFVAKSVAGSDQRQVLCSVVIIDSGLDEDDSHISVPRGLASPGSVSQSCSPVGGEIGTLVAGSDRAVLLVSSSMTAQPPIVVELRHSLSGESDAAELVYSEIELPNASLWVAAEEVARVGPQDQVELIPSSRAGAGR